MVLEHKRIKKIDFTLVSGALLLGIAIVMVNYNPSPVPEAALEGKSLTSILQKMDMTLSLLSEWRAMDVQ